MNSQKDLFFPNFFLREVLYVRKKVRINYESLRINFKSDPQFFSEDQKIANQFWFLKSSPGPIYKHATSQVTVKCLTYGVVYQMKKLKISKNFRINTKKNNIM